MRSPPPVRSTHAVGALMQIWAEGSGFEGIGGLHGWARALVLPAFAHRRFALSDEPSPSAPGEDIPRPGDALENAMKPGFPRPAEAAPHHSFSGAARPRSPSRRGAEG